MRYDSLDNMKNITKYFIFILDELIFIALIIAILYYLKVSIEIFVGVIIGIFIILIFVSYVFLPQFKKPTTGREGLIGMKGVALESFDEIGRISVHGEQWKAVNTDRRIEKNDEVIVLDVQGLTVSVKKI